MSVINHESPEKTARKIAKRSSDIGAGLTWGGYTWQSGDQDLKNVTGRVAKLNALLHLGDVTLSSTSYVDSDGAARPLMWRTLDNQNIPFTVEEFLRFGVAVEEFVENKYFESWS